MADGIAFRSHAPKTGIIANTWGGIKDFGLWDTLEKYRLNYRSFKITASSSSKPISLGYGFPALRYQYLAFQRSGSFRCR